MLITPHKRFSKPWLDSGVKALPAGCRWNSFSLVNGVGLSSPAFEPSTWISWAEQLPDLLKSEAAEPLCHTFMPTSGRRTFRILGPERLPLVVKRYDLRAAMPCSAKVEEVVDQPWRAFVRQIELRESGQRVPEPLLFMTWTQGIAAPFCYVVSRLLENCSPLVDFAFEHLRRQANPPSRFRIWAEDIVTAIARLHQAGYAHGDLHHQNILVRREPTGEHLQVFWTDFDACERVEGAGPHHAQLMDLAMLAASLYQLAPDALLHRALACYFAHDDLMIARRKENYRVIQRAYRSFLEEYRKGFELVEQHFLAVVEQRLARSVNYS